MLRALLITLLGSSLLHSQENEFPNILLLGDSISIGYTPFVQQMLKGKANVVRPMQKDGKRPENCAYAANGVTRIEAWLGDTKWDVIHFNFGLHGEGIGATGCNLQPQGVELWHPPDPPNAAAPLRLAHCPRAELRRVPPFRPGRCWAGRGEGARRAAAVRR